MNWLFAVIVTVVVYLVFGYGSAILAPGNAGLQQIIAGIMMVLSTVWVWWDAKSIGLEKYEGFVSGKPYVVACLCAFIWIFVFPLYLQKRWRITHGQAKLKVTDPAGE